MNEIQRLETERSTGTTLISYYLKEGANTSGKKLASEISAAENIKSEGTRKEVVSNLKAIQRNLKELTKIPEKGLAVFSGNGHYV